MRHYFSSDDLPCTVDKTWQAGIRVSALSPAIGRANHQDMKKLGSVLTVAE